jgi:hypothetical protein
MTTPDIRPGLVIDQPSVIDQPREGIEARREKITETIKGFWEDFYSSGISQEGISQEERIRGMTDYIGKLPPKDQRWLDELVDSKDSHGKLITRAMQLATQTLDEARLNRYPERRPPSVASASRKAKSTIRKRI